VRDHRAPEFEPAAAQHHRRHQHRRHDQLADRAAGDDLTEQPAEQGQAGDAEAGRDAVTDAGGERPQALVEIYEGLGCRGVRGAARTPILRR